MAYEISHYCIMPLRCNCIQERHWKLIVHEQVKKFPDYYRNRKFVTMFRTALDLGSTQATRSYTDAISISKGIFTETIVQTLSSIHPPYFSLVFSTVLFLKDFEL